MVYSNTVMQRPMIIVVDEGFELGIAEAAISFVSNVPLFKGKIYFCL